MSGGITATAHAAMMTEASGLTGRISPTFGYYRQPNGWITVSPVTDLEELKYRREGWERLSRYGRFDMTTYTADHPLEALLQFGGAHELPVEQILHQGLHLNPPRVPACGLLITQFHKQHAGRCWAGAQPVVFPQLEGRTDLEPFVCRFCSAEKPTLAARDQHEGVMHREEKADVRTGESLANALIRGLAGRVAVPAAAPDLAAVLAEIGLTPAQRRKLEALGVALDG